ncbi:MAG: hypothetical protein ACRC6Z_03630, partial [Cetobacterium sp.]
TKNIDFIKKQIGKYEILFIVSQIEIGKTDKILDILKNLEQDTNQVNIFIAIDSKNIEAIDQLIEENFENLTSYMRVENVEIALQGIEGIISFFSPYLMLGEDFRNVIDFLFGRKITPLQIKFPLKVRSEKEMEALFENVNTDGIDEIKISIVGNENLSLQYAVFVSDTIKEKLGFLEEGNHFNSCSINGTENEVIITLLMAKNKN